LLQKNKNTAKTAHRLINKEIFIKEMARQQIINIKKAQKKEKEKDLLANSSHLIHVGFVRY